MSFGFHEVLRINFSLENMSTTLRPPKSREFENLLPHKKVNISLSIVFKISSGVGSIVRIK